ncbi:DUF3798 domain-containing protein [Treponema phagedenis]|uniref:DUF3798 domain-containing protein n=1 Tax=Treponema phagedenis TaxID=162 RepID=A0A0B7GZD5_TREPH|nr:DUF3798 domain-containing protein [Treponema phagedenis]EFW37802.1 hypothetical protein HMPREF9554_01693 [Treponema phagedenis F0421]NVP25152.1 DUF3798 domain-containing protein [Treponema phagedenis]QEJ96030.1 DUF3798 domain-containing protein [Treponema phagedenis]QEJ97266.1 DUF3798 domain-containing protein [Treponema phagedenis]QEK02541.1 DUF3798 domain-containing protein [Treponema phagedenis]
MKLKRSVFLMLIAAAFLLASGCSKKEEEKSAGNASQAKAAYHIGIVTGTVSQSEDDLRGAEKLIELYGAAKDGGMITHITYPDDFMSQQETTISQIVALADDPLMKAIVVNQGVPGTAEALKRVREKNPDILLLVGEPHEDPLVIQQAADMAVNNDFITRGYTIPWAAKQLGAKNFVHISFPRHMSYETLGLRRQIMEEACNDLGLKFIFETAPDPTSDVGVAGAQQFILEKVPQWIEKYGKDTVFFCTNDAHTEPLLKQLFAYGGFFVEADLPSPLMGYPGALGIDLSNEAKDFSKILKKVEEAVIAKGGAGRFGTWAFSYGFTLSVGLGEYARRIIDGEAKQGSLNDLSKALGTFTPGAQWKSEFYIDANTGVRAKNQALVFMDTYIFGKDFLPTTIQEVPVKYFTIKFKK